MNKLHDVVEILKAAGWKDNCDAQWGGIEAALPELAALLSCNSPAVAVPDGYALMPANPSPEMIYAGAEGDSQFFEHAEFVYRRMFAAAQKGGA